MQCNAKLSDWHAEWQSHFENIEVAFTTTRGVNRRADIVEGHFVIEIQHSKIKQEEVHQRTLDYEENGKKVLWIVDGTGMTECDNIITFDSTWKAENFADLEFFFVDVDGKIFKVKSADIRVMKVRSTAVDKEALAAFIKSIKPNAVDKEAFIESVETNAVDKEAFIESVETNAVDKEAFIESIKHDNVNLWLDVSLYKNTLTVKQQGAGNGKTYGIVNMIKTQTAHYDQFIFVTKQHSAKHIMYTEFQDQLHKLGFTDVVTVQSADSKKIIIHFTTNGKRKTLTFATVDSFMFATADPPSNCPDMFAGIVNRISSGYLDKVSKHGDIILGRRLPLNLKTLYVVDETQDLSVDYADAIISIMEQTNMDVYAVGDTLQSITNEKNAFTRFREFQSDTITVTKEPLVNVCRRFTDKMLVSFVNYMIPFVKYDLPKVTPRPAEPGDDPVKYEEFTAFPLPTIGGNVNIDKTIEWIVQQVENEVDAHNYAPNDFLIVTPWVTPGDSAKLMNHVQNALEEFWVNKLGNRDSNFTVLHRSEEGTSINLNESENATRIVSIHSSKGDGRNVVFVIDPSEFKLSAHNIKDGLAYDSQLHVAITRMKKTLYILYDAADSIGVKINNFCIDHNCPGERFTCKIRYSVDAKMLCDYPEMHDVHKKTYAGESDATEITDMSNHYIRHAVMFMNTLRYLVPWDAHNQLRTILDGMHARRSLIEKANTAKIYRNHLSKNTYHPETNPDPIKCIPLLVLDADNHRSNATKIENIILANRQKYLAKTELNPIESMVEYYTYQVWQRGIRSEMQPNEIYRVIRPDFNKTYESTHYARLKHTKKLIDIIRLSHPKLKWQVDKLITYPNPWSNISFLLKSIIPFYGDSDTQVVIVYLEPNLTKFNYSGLRSRSLIDRFIFAQMDEHKKKEFTSYIIALNEPHNPHKMDVSAKEFCDLPKAIQSCLNKHFSRKHVELEGFYNYYRREGDIYAVCNAYDAQNETNVCYIKAYLDTLKIEYRKSTTKGEFMSMLDGNFRARLDEALSDALDNFFGVE